MSNGVDEPTITVHLHKRQLDVLIHSLRASRALIESCTATMNVLTEAIGTGRQQCDLKRGQLEVVLEDLHALVIQVLEQAQSSEQR